ncbi:hypothetical protein LY76DRAFT_331846 [Colletotrichum caudatum]|nr:hypothetical protein LY76DRAFT_331846 [Colletotrichum caudatum]
MRTRGRFSALRRTCSGTCMTYQAPLRTASLAGERPMPPKLSVSIRHALLHSRRPSLHVHPWKQCANPDGHTTHFVLRCCQYFFCWSVLPPGRLHYQLWPQAWDLVLSMVSLARQRTRTLGRAVTDCRPPRPIFRAPPSPPQEQCCPSQNVVHP